MITIGRAARREQVEFDGGESRRVPPPRQADADHQRERPVLAVLAGAQQRHGLFGARVDGEVIAAQALDGEHAAGAQQFGSARRSGSPVCPTKRQRRARTPGSHRLRVEAPVGRIGVLGPARGAHRESGAMVVRDRS